MERQKDYPNSRSLKDSDSVCSVTETLIVPWVFRSEWERACNFFNSENYDELVVELSVWKERVPSLPVGAEATLLLIQAELENKAFKRLSKNTSEVNVRSMYSLAIIRFINHVTHLAIKEYGDASTVSIFKLMAKVNIPEWIVNLRHEASHGTSLPSIETLLLAAQFCKEWLKNNYWMVEGNEVASLEGDEPGPEFFVNRQITENKEDISSKCTTLLSAFIACRVHKLRGNDHMADQEILHIVGEHSYPVKTKKIISNLKAQLLSYLKSDPFEFCAAAADIMLPNKEFCIEIESLFNIDNYFDQLLVIWKPVTEMLNRNGKLVFICVHLSNIHTLDEVNEHVQNLSALWLDNILLKLEQSGKKVSQKLLPVLRIVMKKPNLYTSVFLSRLLKFSEKNLGQDKVNQLHTLANIWTYGVAKGKVKRKSIGKSGNKYFTLESLMSSARGNSQIFFSETNNAVGSWQLDFRGSMNFWRQRPCGTLLK